MVMVPLANCTASACASFSGSIISRPLPIHWQAVHAVPMPDAYRSSGMQSGILPRCTASSNQAWYVGS